MINPNTQLQIGQQIMWGDPAFPKTGIIMNMSQNSRIFFVERLQRQPNEPKYETIERREILQVMAQIE